MEDSLDSNLCLVVPASAEDSEVAVHVGNADNPLGITLGSASSSFSCFELSGKGQDGDEESSESLHIDDKETIPPSPSDVHIDVECTPSIQASSNKSTATSLYESCEGSETGSGGMSPDLIASSDVSSDEMLSSFPKTGGSTDSKNDVALSNGLTESNQDITVTSTDVRSPIDSANVENISVQRSEENYYEDDTESYTPSNFPPVSTAENSNSISNFLQKCASIHDNPSPIILTANTNTQMDSDNGVNNTNTDSIMKRPLTKATAENPNLTPRSGEIKNGNEGLNFTDKVIDGGIFGPDCLGVTDNNMGTPVTGCADVEVLESNKSVATSGVDDAAMDGVVNCQEDIDVPANLQCEHETGYVNVAEDLDSQKVIYKDVSMRKIEDEEVHHKMDEEPGKGFLTEQGVETQEFTQDELNLHLTFESQLFDTSSMPAGESQCLIINEESQISDSTSTKNQNIDGQTDAYSDKASKISTEAQVKENDEILGNKADKPRNYNGSTSDTPGKDLVNAGCSFVTEKDSLANKCNPATIANSQEVSEQTPQSNIVDIDKSVSSGTVPLPLEPADISMTTDDDKVETLPKTDTILQENESQSRFQLSYSKNTVDASEKFNVSSEIRDNKSSEDNVNHSETALKPKSSSQDVSPSMQSTYLDENNNCNNNNASQNILSTHSGSFESNIDCSLPTPTGNSYDASVEYSSLEQDMDLQICDLETQPFVTTPAGIQTPERSESQKQSLETGQQFQVNSDINIRDPVNTIKELLYEIVEAVENKYTGDEKTFKDADVESLNDTLKITDHTEDIALEEYDSQSQSSQNIQLLKSPFRSPSIPAGRQCRKSGDNTKNRARMDGNNNFAKEAANLATEKHDTSSDTLPPDDISDQSPGQDFDPGPNKGENLLYKVTRYAVKETLLNGVVIDTKTIHKRPKFYTTDPYPPSSSQSSNGSGYLADTSSISRTSSDSTTQTDLSLSPGHKARRLSHEPANIPRDLSGGSSSSSGSSTLFLIPGSSVHPRKSMKSLLKENQNFSPDSKSSEKATSPMVMSASSSPTKSSSSTNHSGLGMGESPVLKEGRVILTPLSTELISGTKASENVATPPLSSINPPLSGSTPMALLQQNDSTSDLTTSNSHSPEIQYPTDSLHAISSQSFPPDVTSNPGKADFAECQVQLQKEDAALIQNIETPSCPAKPPKEGIPVMARPAREGYFYPGLLQPQQPESGKYTVFFEDDEKDRLIRENDILLIDMLPVGQEVYAQSDSDDPTGWYSAGTVLGFWREDDRRGYVIQKPVSNTKLDQTKKYTRKQVIVKHDSLSKHLTSLRVQPIPGVTTADVSLDNIMDGKRRSRRSIADSSAVSSPASSRHGTPSPRTPRTPRSSRKRHVEDSQSSGSSSTVPFPSLKKSKRAKLTYGSPRPSRTPSKVAESKALKQSCIFENCGFLLTSTTGKDHPSSDMESPPCSEFRYNRDLIRKRISAGNGLIARSFNQLMSCDRQQRYVISDNYCRTMNYFTALAAGIDCISFWWINHSTDLGELKKTHAYLLPAGYSLQHQRTIERLPVLVQPLSGVRISLHLKDISTWNPLLCIAGCIVVSSRKDVAKNECPLSCDVIVADLSCDAGIIERAKKLDIPIVSIEWIIQCLITSEKLPYDGHHQYTCFT